MSIKLRIAIVLLLSLAVPTAFADTYNVGFISYDLTNPNGSSSGTTQFDITNETGANSSFSADFPITDALTLQNLSLVVSFADLSSETFSLDSTTPLFTTSDQITSATLTGTLTPLTGVNVFGVGTVTLLPDFTATIMPSSGLYLTAGDPNGTLGDFALITASTPPPSNATEPSTLLLLVTGLCGFTLRMRTARALTERTSG